MERLPILLAIPAEHFNKNKRNPRANREKTERLRKNRPVERHQLLGNQRQTPKDAQNPT